MSKDTPAKKRIRRVLHITGKTLYCLGQTVVVIALIGLIGFMLIGLFVIGFYFPELLPADTEDAPIIIGSVFWGILLVIVFGFYLLKFIRWAYDTEEKPKVIDCSYPPTRKESK